MPRWERVLGGAGSEEGRGRVRLARGPPAWTAPPALTGASDWSWASEHSPAETPLVGSPVANLRTFGLSHRKRLHQHRAPTAGVLRPATNKYGTDGWGLRVSENPGTIGQPQRQAHLQREGPTSTPAARVRSRPSESGDLPVSSLPPPSKRQARPDLPRPDSQPPASQIPVHTRM